MHQPFHIVVIITLSNHNSMANTTMGILPSLVSPLRTLRDRIARKLSAKSESDDVFCVYFLEMNK